MGTWDRDELIAALGRISRFGKKLGFARQGLEVFKRKAEENRLSDVVALASAAQIVDAEARRRGVQRWQRAASFECCFLAVAAAAPSCCTTTTFMICGRRLALRYASTLSLPHCAL